MAANPSVARLALGDVDARVYIGTDLGCVDQATRDRVLERAEEVRTVSDQLNDQGRPLLIVGRDHRPFSDN